MSQSQPPLGAFFVDIGAHDAMGSPFQCLAELADRAFTLSEQHSSLDTSNIPLGVKNRFASILYPVGNTDVEPFPIKAVLHQSAPAMQVQQVVIDFQTKTAGCEGQPDLSIEPEQIEHARDEIKPYLQDMWKRNREKERKHHLQEHSDWRDFLERLRFNGMLTTEPYSDPDPSYIHKRCPLCETQTIACTLCHAIMCSNRACTASRLIPFQSCSQHASTATCLVCLESDLEKIDPSLGQCPDCQLWFCQFELTWCLGRPKDDSNRSPSNWHRPIPNSDREHLIKPIRCSSCAGGQDQPHCSNQKCWSRGGRCTSICESCSLGGGLWCTCEQCWICDDCKTSSIDIFKECPRCKGVYCVYECEYIQFCAECGRTTLCDDCVEEDWSCFVGPDVTDGVVLKGCSTGNCMGKICAECLEGTRCAGCSKTFCNSCTRLQRCDSSDDRFCTPCYRARKRRRC